VTLYYGRGFPDVGTLEGNDLVIETQYGEVVHFRKMPEL
jgi:hypothetical protein